MGNSALDNIFEKTANIYKDAGFKIEKNDIQYLIMKSKPESMLSVAAMTYLMIDNVNLDSMSKYFSLNKFLILSEALKIEDEILEILTNEPKESLISRKVINNENYLNLVKTFETKYANELEDLSLLHPRISKYKGDFPKDEIIKAFASTEEGMSDCEKLINQLFLKNKQKSINNLLDILNAQELVSKRYPDNRQLFYFLTKEYLKQIKEI